jgi:hypothetical protein
MSSCKVCGRKVRKTKVALIMRNGTLKGARVCGECESKLGVTIVVAREVPHCKCGNPATKCHACAGTKRTDRKDEVLKTVRSQLAALVRTQRQDGSSAEAFIDGKVEAYEGVISLLEGKVG